MSLAAWSQFKRSWRHQAVMQMTTLGVLVGAFTVLAFAILVQQNLHRVLSQWGQDVRVTVYLAEEADETETSKISEFIQKSEMFQKVDFVSREQAVLKFKDRIGQYAPGLLKDLEYDSPLPASFELNIEGGVQSSGAFQNVVQFAKKVKELAGVEEVSYGQGWVENYAAALKVLSVVSWIFLAVLMCGTLFVVGNSIRSSIQQRRDEIEILELFGATRSAIVWPYVFEGIILGFFASLLALAVSYVLFQWQISLMSEHLNFWSVLSKFEYLTIGNILLIIFSGLAVGGIGAYVWASQANTGWAAAEATKR